MSMDPGTVFTERNGVVTDFDDEVGSGVIADDGSASSWFLHCTRIADGTRSIDLGAPVTFRVAPGPTGFEAVDVRPIPDG